MNNLNHGPSLEDLVKGLPDSKSKNTDNLTIDKCIEYLIKNQNNLLVEHYNLLDQLL